MKRSVLAVLSIILLVSAAARLLVFMELDELLPQTGLYVDEKTFSISPFSEESRGFSRPPGMFLASMVLNTEENTVASRVLMSAVSLLPAAALFLALRKRQGAAKFFFTAGLALSPFMILYGFQLMAAAAAAALISFSLLFAVKERFLLAGFLAGIAALFRAELLLVPVFLFLLTFRKYLHEWLRFALAAAAAVVPVMVLNLAWGAGPVISTNGAENLWIGSDWELLTTPPGVEFEELVSLGTSTSGPDLTFLERAWTNISSDPAEWLDMGLSKLGAFFTLPGPGRNLENGWILSQTGLKYLLLLPLAAMSLALAGLFRRGKEFWQLAAVSIILTGAVSAFVFFPSARFRTAVLPGFWFLAAWAFQERKYLALSLVPAAIIVLMSLTLTYHGMERSGLTSTLASQHFLDEGDLRSSALYLEEAEDRGYWGADLHNIRGALISLAGNPARGLEEFRRALEIAPDSPTLWKNLSVSLWSNGLYSESVHAARRAVNLNPALREQLEPILREGENI